MSPEDGRAVIVIYIRYYIPQLFCPLPSDVKHPEAHLRIKCLGSPPWILQSKSLRSGITSPKTCTSRIRLRQASSSPNSPRFRSEESTAPKVSPEIGRSTSGERGHIVALQLKAIPFIEEFLCRKKVSSGFYPVGAVSAINLQDEPALFLPNPFDALVVYVTQDSLDEIAYDHQAPRVERMVWKLGHRILSFSTSARLCSLPSSGPITPPRSSSTMSYRP